MKINYPFTFQNFYFSKYPVFGYLPKPPINTWVNNQKIFTHPTSLCARNNSYHGSYQNIIFTLSRKKKDSKNNNFTIFVVQAADKHL